jgi:hypothetical protein
MHEAGVEPASRIPEEPEEGEEGEEEIEEMDENGEPKVNSENNENNENEDEKEEEKDKETLIPPQAADSKKLEVKASAKVLTEVIDLAS